MNHNITDLGIPAESELRGIGISMQLISGQEFGSLFAVLEPKARKGDVKAAALDEVRQLATSSKCDVSCAFPNLSLKNI